MVTYVRPGPAPAGGPSVPAHYESGEPCTVFAAPGDDGGPAGGVRLGDRNGPAVRRLGRGVYLSPDGRRIATAAVTAP